jgi:NDP-sugar pyrophosphorylase family protein
MQAVILAGGLGTRLGSITEQMPKPMVLIGGRPYLEYQLRLLAQQSIADIVLLTGYLGEQIEEYFGDGSGMGLRIRYSPEEKPLGTGGALRLARELLADSFLVIYGDSLLPIDYRAVVAELDQAQAEGVVVIYSNRFGDTSVPHNIELAKDGTVARYQKNAPDRDGLEYVDAGVLALRCSVVDLIPLGQVCSLEQDIFPQLIGRRVLKGYPTRQRFYDIGTPERLAVFESYLQR